MFFLYKPVQLVNAKKVLLQDRKFGQIFEENIIREKSANSGEDLYFINKKNKYIWDQRIHMFRKLTNIDETLNQSDFYKMHGLNPTDVRERMRVSCVSVLPPPLIILFRRLEPTLSRSVSRLSSISLFTRYQNKVSLCLNSIFAICL